MSNCIITPGVVFLIAGLLVVLYDYDFVDTLKTKLNLYNINDINYSNQIIWLLENEPHEWYEAGFTIVYKPTGLQIWVKNAPYADMECQDKRLACRCKLRNAVTKWRTQKLKKSL